MATYTPGQINAVRRMASLSDLDGSALSDAACVEYLDWHFANKRTYSSDIAAGVDAIINGAEIVGQQQAKLKSLIEASQ